MTPKKRKRPRWVATRWKSKRGKIGYSIIDLDGVFEVCAVDLEKNEIEIWMDVLMTKRQAIAACERHAREKGRK